MPKTKQYVVHPVAEYFPMLGEAELEVLAEDIRLHGLREPVLLHRDGRVVDGRNRLEACRRAGAEPRFVTCEEPDEGLLDLVLSLNLHRRHLTEGQRAMLAARLATLGKGRPARRENAAAAAFTQAQAAARLGVSPDSIQRAKRVLELGSPELVAAVEGGGINLAEALRALDEGRLPPPAICSGETEWNTPAAYVEAARAALGGLDLDPASSDLAQRTVQATAYHTAATDGLAHPWRGRVWLNPPYRADLIAAFVAKLLAEHRAGAVPAAVLLVHARTDARWFHDALREADASCFTLGRISFERPGETPDSPTTGSVFFYFGRDPAGFAATFRAFGSVVPLRPSPAAVAA